jgi:CRP/FNR family cyclic AMP-dependent transcriptional regulator
MTTVSEHSVSHQRHEIRRRPGRGRQRAEPLLELDPTLGAALTARQRELARRDLVVQTRIIEAGDRIELASLKAPLAVLVVDGVLGLKTQAGHGRALEVLIAGSLCRPDEDNPTSFVDSSLLPLARTKLALLDERVCRWAPIMSEIVSRLCQRTRSAQAQKALDSQSGLDCRVLFCLWHIAERCGRCREEGIEVPLPLTHELLAEILGAARPSVTTALTRLAKAGAVTRTHDRGWLLRHDSLDHLVESTPPPVS